MTDSPETALFQTLRKQMKKEQFTKAIDTCDKLLKITPDDDDVIKVKVVCLINLQKFDNALDEIGGRDALVFEKAYCLYRRNDLDGALSACASIPEPKPDKVQNLMAQAYYKLHQYDEAVSRYEDLADADADGDTDLLTNYYAAQVSNDCGQAALHAHPQDGESVGDCFDLLFNVACAYISSGRISQAEVTLQEALDMCRSVLSDDGLSDEEVAVESTAIALQKTFVDILMGRANLQSLEHCREVLKSRKKGDELMAVAANNLAVLRGDKDLPDSLRRLRSTISSASEEKLTRSQLMELRYNRCILLLHLKKVEECQQNLDELDTMYGVTARSVIIRSSIVAVTGDFEGCDNMLRTEASRLADAGDANAAEKLSVVRVQTLIQRGLYKEAEELLASMDGVRNTAAGISAMYQLKLAQCRRAAVEGGHGHRGEGAEEGQLEAYLLEAAGRLAADESGDDSLRVEALFKIAGELQSRQSYAEAAKVLEMLLGCAGAIDSSQRLVATSLWASSLSRSDPEEAARAVQSLPQVDFSDVDAAALEKEEIPRLHKRVRAVHASEVETEKNTQSGKTAEQQAEHSAAVRKARIERKRAKRREAYLAKLQEEGKYDPARPINPDPERWLPLKHRSYNKRGKKNRNKFVGGQGSGDGAQKDMQKLDTYARVQAAAENQSKTPPPKVISAGSSGPGAKKKSRKKK